MKKISILATTLLFPLLMSSEGHADTFEKCLGNGNPQECAQHCTAGAFKAYTVIFDDPQCQTASQSPNGCYCNYIENVRKG